MNLVPWSSRWHEADLVTLPRLFDQWFDDALPSPVHHHHPLRSGTWVPAVDLRETDRDIIVTVDLPGLDAKEVEVNVDEGRLEIKGERKQEKEVKDDGMRRMERYYGGFQRTIDLPADVDSGKVTAEFDKGVLKVTLPKVEARIPKRVKIDVK